MNQAQEKLIHVSETDLSDMYKDAYGIRPRFYKEWWTEADLEAEYNHLQKQIEFAIEEETKAEAEALVKFETLIQKTIEAGAGDRKTAIRWLLQAEGLDWNAYDLKYFFWGYGLSYELQNNWANALTK